MTTLILIPTAAERRVLQPLLKADRAEPPWRLELCGFGPIAAAARSAQLVAQLQPAEVLLVGIAGTFAPAAAAVGTACRFDSVRCYGVGAGVGREHHSATEMGWAHWDLEPRIGDELPLTHRPDEASPAAGGGLLTCCAASATPREARARAEAFPDAVAEDMEGFAVALSCRLAGVPLSIVRGISNRAGDRDQRRWRIDEALAAAAELSRRVLGHG